MQYKANSMSVPRPNIAYHEHAYLLKGYLRDVTDSERVLTMINNK